MSANSPRTSIMPRQMVRLPIDARGDPLTINYILAMPDETLRDASPFQGFSRGWREIGWALRMLATLPADALERASDPTEIISQRMGGMRQLSWSPLVISSLEKIKTEHIGPLVVIMSGELDAARRVSNWAIEQSSSILHISAREVAGAIHPAKFTDAELNAYCKAVLASLFDSLSPSRREAAAGALDGWQEHPPVPSGIKRWGHNVVIPNHLSLERAGRSLTSGEMFIGREESEYVEIILESAKAVAKVREEVGLRSFHAMTLLQPELLLTEPALFRHTYKRRQVKDISEDKAVQRVLRLLQAQKSLATQTTKDILEVLRDSEFAQYIIHTRQEELETHSLGVGLRAAQTCSEVVRLSPSVNHVFAELASFARSVRSGRPESKLKSRRLFEGIQRKLADAVGPKRLSYIAQERKSIKIVADAPIEWLPIGLLPLSMHLDCSRINATPGNLMMGLLREPDLITVTPKELQKVLVVSSFTDDDPLRLVLVNSVNATREQWDGKVEVIFRVAQTRAALIEVLNKYDGLILVFDGHGVANDADPISTLRIGSENIDVWSLRGEVRVPPIVILSACDTQGIDSSTHATVGNGFLALGARTVLATMLPVNAFASASFISRLIYRFADFLPVVMKGRQAVLSWTEVISGMLRMYLASEILNRLVGDPGPLESPRGQLQLKSNIDINSFNPLWFERLIEQLVEHRGESRVTIEDRVAGTISRSEAIRYVQLGNPESILIDDGSIRSNFIPSELLDEIEAAKPSP